MKTKYLFLIINHTSTHPMSGCPPHCTDPGTLCCCLAGSAPSPCPSQTFCAGPQSSTKALLPHPASDFTIGCFSFSPLTQGCPPIFALTLDTPHQGTALCRCPPFQLGLWQTVLGRKLHSSYLGADILCYRVHEYTLTSLGMHPLISKVSSPNLDTFVTLLGL